VSTEKLDLCIGQLLAGQEDQHLVAKEMRMHVDAQPGGLAVALHDLLYPENQPEGLRKQDVRVLASIAR
jgi:hypothetical protein